LRKRVILFHLILSRGARILAIYPAGDSFRDVRYSLRMGERRKSISARWQPPRNGGDIAVDMAISDERAQLLPRDDDRDAAPKRADELEREGASGDQSARDER
jgi:hypothetical protein